MRRRSKGEDGDRMTPLGFRCCDELLGDTGVMMIMGRERWVREGMIQIQASSSTEEMRNRREDEKMQNGVREEKEERETLTVESVVEAIQQQCIDVIEGEESIDDRVKERYGSRSQSSIVLVHDKVMSRPLSCLRTLLFIS